MAEDITGLDALTQDVAPTGDDAAEGEQTTDETASGTAPDGESEEEQIPEEQEGSEEEGEETGEDDTKYVDLLGQKTIDELVEMFAKRTGLDPKDPQQAKTLKTFADQLRYIEQLRAEKKGPTQESALTEFERALAEEDETSSEETAAAKGEPQAGKEGVKPPAADSQQQGARYGDIGDQWKTPEDSIIALEEAYEKGDRALVHQIEVARQIRNFDTFIAKPFFETVRRRVLEDVRKLVENQLGDVIPEIRTSIQRSRSAANQDFAISQLSKVKGFEGLNKFLEPEEGPPVVIDGAEFPNSPLNRILKEYPEILDIRVLPTDPKAQQLAKQHKIRAEDAAERLTFIRQYRAAMRYSQRNRTDAKKLLDAGAKLAQKQEQDKTRQTLNKGSGTTPVGKQSPASDRELSLDDL